MAKMTTMKITTDTRDRLRALGAEGDSVDVVAAALDVYESHQFWAAADAALGSRDTRAAHRADAPRGRGQHADGRPAWIAPAGEIWLTDRGDEPWRLVFIISDARFHRISERAVVAPVLDGLPASRRPWHVPFGDRAVAVSQLGTAPACARHRAAQLAGAAHCGGCRAARGDNSLTLERVSGVRCDGPATSGVTDWVVVSRRGCACANSRHRPAQVLSVRY